VDAYGWREEGREGECFDRRLKKWLKYLHMA
jgi:hypothetical protein